jgi:hypothetical protein
MISIIVCSRNKSIPDDLARNIEDTINVDYEIVHINNSENQFSICSAYNEGFSRSKFQYLCFVHEDVCFRSKSWGEKIVAHLQKPNVGLLGLAGRDYLTRVPASWSAKMEGMNIVQSDKTGKKATKTKCAPIGYDKPSREVVMLDGVLLCMRRDLMNNIKFDETHEGFHGYDFDISIQSVLAGKTNYVMYDMLLEHFSRGTPDADYYRSLIKVFKKWEKCLPLLSSNVSENFRNKISEIEKRGIRNLSNKLVRRGVSTNEIMSVNIYFSNLIGVKQNQLQGYLQIYFSKLINYPTRLFSNK